MPTLLFKPTGAEIQVDQGETILDAALDNDIALNHECGGVGACATCHIIVEQGLETLHEKTEEELDMLEFAEGMTENSRLACQCEIGGDLVLLIPAG
jgi:2Fe-2S ferredoxin